ncbi:hypothetical protein SPRG_02641 [Saprolegnia parasitica CBS 223.65]|uniref:HECT-type E3 ubiquitin transferase n=1 Tax=Saprolegnia parasitica (strain CBS 223.65) TaxID=695850 RepID=A0A067CR00_SAPPC|nr:hypothetical protein SPRG_02641 [Saprolegnia parasitica CBS 223.65]KDO32948.1 hypothetical protein SPRG_02641 [Saprolegnia parasitica CBS 223.65]|eukprot:XP_012196595.1 hypothetical protein SPRG_02641 [Saprolegnia parasitica CBS 223.65]
MDFPTSSNSPSDGGSRTLWFFGLCASIVLFVLFLGIVNHCYNKHYGMPLPAPAVTNQNFHEFMPGIKRGDVEELLANVERWECSICAFQSLLQKPACSLCGTPKDTRLVEVSPEVVVPRLTRSSSVLRRSSINYRHRSKSTLPRHSMRRLSVLFQKAIVPDDLNARQRSARMRKQWSRQIDGAGHVSWKRHFLDSEDFPAAFFVQLNPSQDEMFANHEVEPLDECVVITLRGSIVRGLDKTQDTDRVTEPDSPVDESEAGAADYSELKSAKAIAWLDLATGDPNKTVLGTSISEAMWNSLLPLTKLAFTLKYAWFLHQTADLFVPYDELYIKTKVNRNRLFEEALENLLHLDGRALCAILRFQFVGESGLDAGAIQREWYMLVAQAMLSESSGMFIEANRDDHSFFINPNCAADMTRSETAVHYLDAFRAAGRFIGRALLDGQVLPLHLSPVLFKALLGMPCTLDDIETLDKTLYKSLRYLLDNKHVDELALTFSVTQERAGKLIEVDLVPHGQDVPVTDANKHAYIERMMRYLLFERIQDPLHALIQGTYDVVPPELLLVFDHKELELILCGQSDIDVDDWETSTITSSNLKNSAVLEWFWQLVRALSCADQAKLLQYATGSSRVPVQGFQGLTSYDGKICYFTLKGVPYTLGAYPVAHACYNRIDLPLYPTQELLDDAVRTLLLSDPTGFNMQ